jgi:hypothetical protein
MEQLLPVQETDAHVINSFSRLRGVLSRTGSASLVGFLLYWTTAVLAQGQSDYKSQVARIDAQIATLKETVDKNDNLLTPPANWRSVSLIGNDGDVKGIMPNGPDLGMVAWIQSDVHQEDPVIRLGKARDKLIGPKYRRVGQGCSGPGRLEFYKGYLALDCVLQDVTDDSLNYLWLAGSDFSTEVLWFRAPNKALFDQSFPLIRLWTGTFLSRRLITSDQQAKIAALLAQKEHLWWCCRWN